MANIKAFVSWSGGKDSALACFRAIKEVIEVCYLLNMLREDGKMSRSHGLTKEIILSQAEAMGIPILQKGASWGSYEEAFKEAVSELKAQGINAGVFGDIDVEEHRAWVERVCSELEVKPFLPLWLCDRESLMKEFINAGFKAVVCAVNANYLGPEWLGREVNFEFLEELKKLGTVDLCGEKGEYHTFVYDGPFFKHPVKFALGKVYSKNNKFFIEVGRG